MTEAVGLSRLYPAVPIMNFVSMTLLLLLIPGFWKTRMVALVSLVFWIVLGNLVSFICMIEWRGNTNDAPIWATIVAILDRIWFLGFFTSMACFAHFTWHRLQPLAVRQLYDNRRRNNLIHFSLTLILPPLWVPLLIFSWETRYIMEDHGPTISARLDWPGFVVCRLPQIICLFVIGIFNSLAVFNYWRTKGEHFEPDPLKQHYSIRTRKLIIMAHFHILFVVYGVYRQVSFGYMNVQEWVAPTSLAENIASLHLVLERTRPILESDWANFLKDQTITKITIPLLGFHLFAWFGFETEIRKAYREVLSKLICAAFREHGSHLCPLPFCWSLIALRKAEPQHGSTDASSLIDLNVPQITPYISTAAQGDDRGSHEGILPSYSAIDVKRQARERAREPARRLSSHKPSFAPLNPANAAMNISNSVPLRRLSHHKPPLPPGNPTASAPGSVALRVEGASNTGGPKMPSTPSPSALYQWYHKPPLVVLGSPTDPAMAGSDASGGVAPRVEGPGSARRQEEFALRDPPRRLSYHKLPFVPSGCPDASAIATPEASGCTPSRTEGVNNPRRQEMFAPRARPRRLSYHKPASVPLAPVNAGAIANGLGLTVPLVEATRDRISDRDARVQAATVSDSGIPPPPFSRAFTSTAPPPFPAPFASMVLLSSFSSSSTSMAPPPPFSSPSTSTAAPPCSDVSTPLSTPSTTTPAPPYQDVNSLLDHAT